MRKWIIILIAIICMQTVYGEKGEIEVYKPREIFDLSVHLTDSDGEVKAANCSVQIRNETMDILINDNMEEIGNGWYNYTYNTSDVGKYFCRQNCTEDERYIAGTCDFEIQGDETMPIASILVLIFVIIVWLLLANYFRMEMFSEHGGVKMMLMLLVMWMLLLPLSIATQYGITNGDPTIVTDQMQLFTSILIWINVFVTFYFVVWFIIQLVRKFREAAG